MKRNVIETGRHVGPSMIANAALLQVLGRLAIAPLFLLSGIAKLLGPEPYLSYISSAGLPLPTVALGVAILVELLGGALLVIGYKTRVVAAIMAVFTFATALIFHHKLSDPTEFLFFFKNLAIAGGLLQIVAFGGGRWSVDRD